MAIPVNDKLVTVEALKAGLDTKANIAPAPFVVTITTGQWSGSGSDRYITVTASNMTENAMLYPFFDDASSALLNGPVWCVPAAGSFTIHTSAIPSGTVTISVLLAGILGEAQYQVLADVYSKSQTYSKDQVYTKAETNSAISQSTANTLLYITKHNIVIGNGSSSSPSIINVDLSADIGDNSLWGADVYVNSGGTIYKLPYLHNSNGTYMIVQGYSGKTITIKNTSTGWGTCTLYIVAYIAKV